MSLHIFFLKKKEEKITQRGNLQRTNDYVNIVAAAINLRAKLCNGAPSPFNLKCKPNPFE
jgi:hypothetical protein